MKLHTAILHLIKEARKDDDLWAHAALCELSSLTKINYDFSGKEVLVRP